MMGQGDVQIGEILSSGICRTWCEGMGRADQKCLVPGLGNWMDGTAMC